MGKGSRFPALAVLALVFALVAACSDSAPSASLGVQPAWQSARLSPGHRVHVAKLHVPCAQCHDLSGDSVGIATVQRCAACHQKESRLRHAQLQAVERFGEGAKADCTSCHAFSGTDTDGGVVHAAFAPTECARCHATPQGSIPAILIHASAPCVTCHRPHEDATPVPAACASCHQKIATTHAALGKSAQQVCTTCHEHQHAPASAAIATCAACHAVTQPIVPKTALFENGHVACVGCHAPHQFEKSAVLPCRSCHANLHVLAESSVLAHGQCTSCHTPHDVRGSPEKACATCHANVHPDHPTVPGKGTCTSCHEPHPATAHALEVVAKCSSCHQTAHSERAFHQGVTCTQCHQPHAFKLALSDRNLCRNCHAQELSRVTLRTGHQNCAGCHGGLPHRPTELLASCATCHAREQSAVNRGHAKCTTCHEPHSGAQSAACQSCHQNEARSAPAGHAKCTTCHEPHTGSVASAPACASCHVSQASSKHGQLPGGCTSCHQPHAGAPGKVSPPACATCHQTSSLPGLHQQAKHRQCASCHTGHDDQSGVLRAACLGCHTDRKTHFPDAARCASCHLFDRGK